MKKILISLFFILLISNNSNAQRRQQNIIVEQVPQNINNLNDKKIQEIDSKFSKNLEDIVKQNEILKNDIKLLSNQVDNLSNQINQIKILMLLQFIEF